MLIKKKEIWTFIPARSGSKTIPNKNIKKINNIPLIGYAIKSSNKIKLSSKTIFSSDSKKYFEIAKKYGHVEFDFREKKFAKDDTLDIDVFLSYIKKLILKKITLPEFFIHLRPTCPFRKNKILNHAVNFFLDRSSSFSSMRSVTEMSTSSYKTMRIINGKLCSIKKKNFNMDKLNFPRQDYQKTFYPNSYIDILKTSNILLGTFHGKKTLPYIIKNVPSEIDTKEDYKLIKKLNELKPNNLSNATK